MSRAVAISISLFVGSSVLVELPPGADHATAQTPAVSLLPVEVRHSNGAELEWTFSGDRATFEKYEVHRATAPGFTPSDSTLLMTTEDVDATSFVDTTAAPNDAFFYKVVVNSTPSNEESAALPQTSQATTALQEDENDMDASYLEWSSAGTVCTNYGSAEALRLGTGVDSKYRPVLNFDLRDVPLEAKVLNATLTLRHPTTNASIGAIDVHPVKSPWAEGTGVGIACEGGGATWYEPHAGVLWEAEGGDIGPSVARIPVKDRTQAGSDTVDLTALVQEWVIGDTVGFGVLLKLVEETASNSNFSYYSDDHPDPALRPKLVVSYEDGSKAVGPEVAVATPTPGKTRGAVTLTASVHDDRRVEKVEFHRNGVLIATDTTEPFEATWDTTAVPNGSYDVTVTGYDDVGNSTTSAAQVVNVDNSAPPTTKITSPKNAATVKGSVKIAADASDDVGVTQVEFLADGMTIGKDTTAPYGVTWNTLSPSAPVYDGTHTLMSEVTDTSDQVVRSAPVSVTVANTAGTKYRASYDLNLPGVEDDGTAIPHTVDEDPHSPSPEAGPLPITPAAAGEETSSTSSSTSSSSLDDPPSDSGSLRLPTAPAPKPLGVKVIVTNESGTTWNGADLRLWYRWYKPDRTVVYQAPASEAFPAVVPAGGKVILPVDVVAPSLPDGTDLSRYRLRFDIYDSDPTLPTGATRWFAAQGNLPADEAVMVEAELARRLGLERYYHYVGEEVGAGMQHLLNVANGNSLLRWTPFSSPGRGLSTVLSLTYNSREGLNLSPVGNGWSISVSSLARFGLPLRITPGVEGELVEFTDGDGTTHRFKPKLLGGWEEPPGVNLYLRRYSNTDTSRAWAITRPDRVTFFFDALGYPTFVEDKNGNRIEFKYETIVQLPGVPQDPTRRVTEIVDPGGQRFVVDYYEPLEGRTPLIGGKIESITDHGGHALRFEYYDDGNLRRITQVGGHDAAGATLASRTFEFAYTAPDGNGPATTPLQSTRIHSVRDPRGKFTYFSYCTVSNCSGEALNLWKLRSRTNRAAESTSVTYDIDNRLSTVQQPLSRTSTYRYDEDGKVTRITDPIGGLTQLDWSADFNVTKVTEPTGAATRFDYNANGYPTSVWDQLNNQTVLSYQNLQVDAADSAGHISQLQTKTDPRGFQWQFGYDSRGNLTSVKDAESGVTGFTYNGDGTLATATDPIGMSTTADPNDRVTRFLDYDANGLATKIIQRVSPTESLTTTLHYDNDGLLRWVQTPEHVGYTGTRPREFRTYFDYDAFHRLGQTSMPKSTRFERSTAAIIWSAVKHDANDNVIKIFDPTYGGINAQTPTTSFVYDDMDRRRLVTKADGEVPDPDQTEFVYDDAGRVSKITYPEGMLTTNIADDHAVSFAYDLLDRVVKEVRQNKARDGTSQTIDTWFCYDRAGDLRWVTAPNAEVAALPTGCEGLAAVPPTLTHTTRYVYDAAHRLTLTEDPEGRERKFEYFPNGTVKKISTEIGDGRWSDETREYDGRNLLTKVTQPFEGDQDEGGKVTTLYGYDAAGNLTRIVSPRGWDASTDKVSFPHHTTRYSYDEANRMTRIDLPVGPSADKQYYVHRNYGRHGFVIDQSYPTDKVNPEDASIVWDTMMYYDPGWLYSLNTPGSLRTRYDYEAPGWQKARWNGNNSNKFFLTAWSYFDDGTLKSRTDPSAEGSGGIPQGITYRYDANNNLKQTRDTSGVQGDELPIAVNATYDWVDRPEYVDLVKGTQQPKVTLYAYDANSNVKRREDQGRVHLFDYDRGDFLTTHIDQGENAPCSDDRITQNVFLNPGWEKTRSTYRGCSPTPENKRQTTDWGWFANGLLRTLETKSHAGATTRTLESHTIAYEDATTSIANYVNGHRTRDTFSVDGPGTDPCPATNACKATFTYDGRDKLTKHDNGKQKVITYELDGTGNVLKETNPNATPNTRVFAYDGTMLKTIRDTNGGLLARYWYRDDGNLDCVTSATTDVCNNRFGVGPSPELREDYTYDHLERLVTVKRFFNGAMTDTARYTYDALDRVVKETEDHGGTAGTANDRTVNFSFLGLTRQVTQEVQNPDDQGAENVTKSYSYDAWGQRVGMSKTEGTATESYLYGYDSHGSVSLLIAESGPGAGTAGTAKASYGYTPYGDRDPALTQGDTSVLSPINPYRYAGRRLDTGSGAIDMGARMFDAGEMRFFQEDTLQGALGDLSLSTDPLTQNRFSLAGGNPVSFVEWDGHVPTGDGGGGSANGPNPSDNPEANRASWSYGSDDGGASSLTGARERGSVGNSSQPQLTFLPGTQVLHQSIPVEPDLGRIWGTAFISTPIAGLPGASGAGDDRSFSSTAGPDRSRGFFYFDFYRGDSVIAASPSCDVEGPCEDALPFSSHGAGSNDELNFADVQVDGNSITLHLDLEPSRPWSARQLPLSITAHITIRAPEESGGEARVSGTHDWYPSWEIHQSVNGTSRTIHTYQETDLGALGLAFEGGVVSYPNPPMPNPQLCVPHPC